MTNREPPNWRQARRCWNCLYWTGGCEKYEWDNDPDMICDDYEVEGSDEDTAKS